MEEKKKSARNPDLLHIIYSSSMGISLTAQVIVGILEVFMLLYTLINPALYGPYIGRYRAFYCALLAVSVAYILLNVCYAKKDMAHRYPILKTANLLCAGFFFIWSLGITYSDASVNGLVDPTVFMTFSLTVPLSFYLLPGVYVLVATVADVLMLALTVYVTGTAGAIINLAIFFVFQLVLGASFLHLKMRLAERILVEQEHAVIDVLTGLSNRRAYEEALDRHAAIGKEELVYAIIDINGLKNVNDTLGHDAGDRLIIGAAQCIQEHFALLGEVFRIGGDEFVLLLNLSQERLPALLDAFDKSMETWSAKNGLTLCASYGYTSTAEYPEKSLTELCRIADERMYAAKARFYQENGRDRRGSHPAETTA